MTDLATLGRLLQLARDTVREPREGVATVLSFAPPRQALWLMFALVIVVTIFLGTVAELFADPIETSSEIPVIQFSPVTLGLAQGVLFCIMIHAIYWIGRAFGGTGQFHERGHEIPESPGFVGHAAGRHGALPPGKCGLTHRAFIHAAFESAQLTVHGLVEAFADRRVG